MILKPQKIITLLITIILLTVPSAICTATETLTLDVGNYTCQVTFYSPSIVRVCKFPKGKPITQKSLAVILEPEQNLKVNVKRKGRYLLGKSSELEVAVDERTGNVSFRHGAKRLLREKSFSISPCQRDADAGRYRINQTFTLDKNEAIYGLGTLQDGKLNRRNTHVRVEQSNLQDFQNVIQSIKGYGIFFDNYSVSHFDDDSKGMSMTSEVGEGVDYYLLYGGSIDGVVAQLRNLTGKVPMFPLWSFGYMQSRERYKSTKEVLDVARRYRQLRVPLDCMIQDWQYWGSNYTWNAMDYLADSYKDGKHMADSLHKMGAKLMISIWSNFGPMTKGYQQLKEKDLLFTFETWPQYGLSDWPSRMDYPSGVRVYKPYSKTATDIYWSNLKTLFDYETDAWWMDSTDPDQFNLTEANYDEPTALGSYRAVRNAFPLCTVKGVYENQRKTTSDKRVCIMTRSAFAGQQHYGSNMWSGDVVSTWDSFRKQIPLGLNFSVTGNPNFNTDIGGFFCGAYNVGGLACKNPQFQELYVRWLQYGAFCPMFRSHGTDSPREIYQFGKKGEPVYDAIEKTIRLRYRLMPYIYSLAWQVSSNNDSYMRPLVADYPEDRRLWNLTDEFMFGHAFLVAPIVTPQYTEEKIVKADAITGLDNKQGTTSEKTLADFKTIKTATKYLPRGKWYDFWTGKRLEGGRNVELTTQFDEIPLFVREGSIIPIAEVMQFTGERPWDELELRVYPGQDATFTLYEDEGDNYNYEKGAYSIIEFNWNESQRILTIANRKGQFADMLQSRRFSIKIVGTQFRKDIVYNGTQQKIHF